MSFFKPTISGLFLGFIVHNPHSMKILISRDRYIDNIKKEFAQAFPFLKIDFKQKPLNLQSHPKARISYLPQRVCDFANNAQDGVLSISENNSIKQIITKLEEHFGLNAQFFRKSGNSWVEIRNTVDWTLKQQNESGMEVY